MADKLYNEASIQAIADAIRAKSGKTDTMKVSEMAGEIGNLSGEADINNLIAGTLSGDLVFTATSIGRCFANTTGVFTLSFPNATSFRVNYTIENSTVVAVSAPLITRLPNYCFQNSQQLSAVDFPLVTQVNFQAFVNCKALTSINLSKATIQDQVFQGCSNLLCAVIGTTGTYYRQFYGCTKLKVVDMCKQGRLHQLTNGSSSFDTLILRDTALTTLYYVAAFDNTPFASGGTGGTIYIPKVLYDELGTGSANDYKAATNWSTVDAYGTITWAQIEGSIYETQYADGTPIETGGDS